MDAIEAYLPMSRDVFAAVESLLRDTGSKMQPVLEHLQKHWPMYAVIFAGTTVVAFVCPAYGITLTGTVVRMKDAVLYGASVIKKACEAVHLLIRTYPITSAGIGLSISGALAEGIKIQTARTAFTTLRLQRQAEMQKFNRIRKYQLEDLGVDVDNDAVLGRYICPVSHDLLIEPVNLGRRGGVPKYYEREMIVLWGRQCAANDIPFTVPETRDLIRPDELALVVDVAVQAAITTRLHELLEFIELPTENTVMARAAFWQNLNLPPPGPTLRGRGAQDNNA